MVILFAGCGLIQAYRLWKQQRRKNNIFGPELSKESPERQRSVNDITNIDVDSSLIASDPGLLRKHSTFKTYTTPIATYNSIRTFYRPHPQADKLPKDPPLPLIVFIHGLGGSLAQFHPLLTSLVNIAPSLGIDLPGCGLSKFSSSLPWEAYSTIALCQLLNVVIEHYCDRRAGQGVVLIGHSMGCSLSTMLASTTSSYNANLEYKIIGLIAICPKASTPSDEQIIKFRRVLRIPSPIFDLWRRWDRRGGTESASVARFVPRNADIETKKLQHRFNEGSRTSVWRRMAWGALPGYRPDGSTFGGLPGCATWAGLLVPLFLVAGEADTVTKPEEIEIISTAIRDLREKRGRDHISENIFPEAAGPDTGRPTQISKEIIGSDERYGLELSNTETTTIGSEKTSNSDDENKISFTSKQKGIVKATVLPSPASHALLYDHATYRTLAGLIQSFLADHIDDRLSLGWQLRYLCTEGKWEVKNLAKWQAVKTVSDPIAGIFRAMKTLREIDESHSPAIFVKDWHDMIKAVIDISHESPVYDPRGLESGGIEYHKFPTVSKIPPTSEEVRDFITLVDRLRLSSSEKDNRLIGVHCHYGFNRTGFFICSYLIEKEGYSVQQALGMFEKGRPPGIRHEHFIDTLFVRYCVGLKRAPTL
ncbi:hypothetical protein MMC11_001818 [Xylographa trunciseda]|nr:hypothetical protein [Xylographa trunciseda]